MKKTTDTNNLAERAYARVLTMNSELIRANILRILAKQGLIKYVDATTIEHDRDRVVLFQKDFHLRILKEEKGDFIFEQG